jgi:type I restriction enzyme S subunit
MPVIKLDVLSEKTIKIPSPQTIQNFNNQVKPILDEILNLQLQNQNLKSTRDLLIPRLVSGKLDVENLNIV